MPDPESPQEPFTQTPEERESRRAQAARQLVLAYKRCFTTASGLTVLADLKAKFGFDRWEAEDTEDDRKIIRRTCAKGPIFHIERQLRTQFRAGRKIKQLSAKASP